jgi:hypothetical protein
MAKKKIISGIEIHNLLQRISYKPGFRAQYLLREDDNLLELTFSFSDVRTGFPGTFKESWIFPKDFKCEQDLFLENIKEAIDWFEVHERKEYLCLDGKQLDDPHPENNGGKRDGYTFVFPYNY